MTLTVTVTTAMILAAGRGNRLRPLTDATPKPLLKVAGKTLIDHHLDRLLAIGIQRVVVNLHHLGDRIRAHLEARPRTDMELLFSEEHELLETAGGIQAALPLLGAAPFMVVNGDVFTDFDLSRLLTGPGPALAHLVMVPSPAWATAGDFDLAGSTPVSGARVPLHLGTRAHLTFAGIGSYRPEMFTELAPGPMPLRPVFDAAIAAGRVTGELHAGIWDDIGTLERLDRAREVHGN